jgi:hypothetical protein
MEHLVSCSERSVWDVGRNESAVRRDVGHYGSSYRARRSHDEMGAG